MQTAAGSAVLVGTAIADYATLSLYFEKLVTCCSAKQTWLISHPSRGGQDGMVRVHLAFAAGNHF